MARDELPSYARQFKAALDLRGWTIAQLANEMPPQYRLGKSTLDKISRGLREPLDWEYPVIASLLDVPEWFLRDGLAAAAISPSEEVVDQALEEIADVLERLVSRVSGQAPPRAAGSSA